MSDATRTVRARTIRVGIVGPGWWTETMYLPALANHPNADVVAVCGRNAERTQTYADTHSIRLAYTDVEEMCASGEVDAVLISTTNDTHRDIALTAIDHGMHVLCEKPLALDGAQADEMAAAARAAGVVTHVPFTYRFMPTSQYVKRLIDDGYIGRPYLLNLRYYASFARDGEYAWRFDLERAGSGVLGDIGSHWLDMAQWLFGDIVAVTCSLTHLVERGPRPDGTPYEVGDDGANILIEFANGAHGVIVVSALCHESPPFEQRHIIDAHGSDGTISSLNDWVETQLVQGAKVGEPLAELPIPDDIWGDVRRNPVHDTYRDVFRSTDALARRWITAIIDGTDPQPTFDEGASIQRLLDACVLSAAEGRRVEIGSGSQ